MINNSCDSRTHRVSKEVWNSVRAAYQKGEGSCRELAEQFGLTLDQVRNKCRRAKWSCNKSELQEKLDAKVTQKVTQEAEKLVHSLAAQQARQTRRQIERAERYLADIDKTREQLTIGNDIIVDPVALESLSRTEARIHELLRQALQMPDKVTPAEVNVSVGVGIHQFPPEQLQHLNEARKRWMERMQGGGLNA